MFFLDMDMEEWMEIREGSGERKGSEKTEWSGAAQLSAVYCHVLHLLKGGIIVYCQNTPFSSSSPRVLFLFSALPFTQLPLLLITQMKTLTVIHELKK